MSIKLKMSDFLLGLDKCAKRFFCKSRCGINVPNLGHLGKISHRGCSLRGASEPFHPTHYHIKHLHFTMIDTCALYHEF